MEMEVQAFLEIEVGSVQLQYHPIDNTKGYNRVPDLNEVLDDVRLNHQDMNHKLILHLHEPHPHIHNVTVLFDRLYNVGYKVDRQDA